MKNVFNANPPYRFRLAGSFEDVLEATYLLRMPNLSIGIETNGWGKTPSAAAFGDQIINLTKTELFREVSTGPISAIRDDLFCLRPFGTMSSNSSEAWLSNCRLKIMTGKKARTGKKPVDASRPIYFDQADIEAAQTRLENKLKDVDSFGCVVVARHPGQMAGAVCEGAADNTDFHKTAVFAEKLSRKIPGLCVSAYQLTLEATGSLHVFSRGTKQHARVFDLPDFPLNGEYGNTIKLTSEEKRLVYCEEPVRKHVIEQEEQCLAVEAKNARAAWSPLLKACFEEKAGAFYRLCVELPGKAVRALLQTERRPSGFGVLDAMLCTANGNIDVQVICEVLRQIGTDQTGTLATILSSPEAILANSMPFFALATKCIPHLHLCNRDNAWMLPTYFARHEVVGIPFGGDRVREGETVLLGYQKMLDALQAWAAYAETPADWVVNSRLSHVSNLKIELEPCVDDFHMASSEQAPQPQRRFPEFFTEPWLHALAGLAESDLDAAVQTALKLGVPKETVIWRHVRNIPSLKETWEKLGPFEAPQGFFDKAGRIYGKETDTENAWHVYSSLHAQAEMQTGMAMASELEVERVARRSIDIL